MTAITKINEKQLKKIPELAPGDTVRVHAKIIEGNKERIQIFEGVVLRVKGSGMSTAFTVRKISYGVGVERIFLANSPKITKIQIIKRAKVRRAYLTYLRALRGKRAKLHDKQFDSLAVNIKEEELKPEELAPPVQEGSPNDTVGKEADKELTEINSEEVQDIKAEASTEDLVEEENKPEVTAETAEIDETSAPEAEIAEGLTEAAEGGSKEGKKAEKVIEEKIEE